MNAPQFLTTPNGERLVVLTEADYLALVEAAEDAADIAAHDAFLEKLARGEEELIPSAVVDRLLSGESRVRVWREHRGLSITELAKAAGLSQPYLSQIERGTRKGRPDSLAAIAKALRIDPEDLEPPPPEP